MKRLYIPLVIFIASLLHAGNPGIIFKENKGQWPNKVLFGSEFLNTKFYVNKNSFNYCIYDQNDLLEQREYMHHKNEKADGIIKGHNYEVSAK